MNLMSIDQSLSCSGIVIWVDGKFKTWDIIKTDTKQGTILRIREIAKKLNELVKTHNIDYIVIESLPFGINSTSVRPLAALYYCIWNTCINLGIEFTEANVTAVKKSATGSGKAKKGDMIEALLSTAPEVHASILKAGVKKTTGLADLADAYFIGNHHLGRKGKDIETK